MVAQVRDRLGMYTGRGTFGDACALLVGFDLALDGGTLHRFYEWLCLRRPDYANYWISGQIALDIGGDRSAWTQEQDRAAVAHLFDLLSEFLADDGFGARTEQARERLRAAAEVLPMRPDTARVIRSHLDRGPLVQAFRNLVGAAEDVSPEHREAVLPALQAALALLQQDRHPHWKQRVAGLADDIRAGIHWRAQPEVAVFIATRDTTPAPVDFSALDPAPEAVPPFPLEDEMGLLPGWSVTELDLRFDAIPEPLARYLRDVLRTARDTTGGVVWLAFEGSFSFDGILTEPRSVYGVCAPDMPPQVAIDGATLRSDEWSATVAAARRELL